MCEIKQPVNSADAGTPNVPLHNVKTYGVLLPCMEIAQTVPFPRLFARFWASVADDKASLSTGARAAANEVCRVRRQLRDRLCSNVHRKPSI